MKLEMTGCHQLWRTKREMLHAHGAGDGPRANRRAGRDRGMAEERALRGGADTTGPFQPHTLACHDTPDLTQHSCNATISHRFRRTGSHVAVDSVSALAQSA